METLLPQLLYLLFLRNINDDITFGLLTQEKKNNTFYQVT